MAVKFLEPGGDADFLVGTTNGFWVAASAATIATDFVHGGHQKSISYAPSTFQAVNTIAGVLNDAGSRISFYIYLVALPTNSVISIVNLRSSGGSPLITIRITNAGVLQLWNATTAQIGSNGGTLSTGQWYRISLAFTIASTTVNRFELFVNGVSGISVTNATITAINTNYLGIGNFGNDTTLNFRTSDHYVDDSSALTDTGNIWVTAKRPNANGTTNGFSTQIGSGGSGYGSGHSPQVNERALDTANGWSMVGAGSAVTEEYNIESKATGDIDISAATIIDWLGWVSIKALVGETINVIINGANVAQAITSTITLYTKIKGSSTYPAGTGADIGVTTDTSLTTVSLYEAGVLVAFIPPGPSASPSVSPSKSPSLSPSISSSISLSLSPSVSPSTSVSPSRSPSISSSISPTISQSISPTISSSASPSSSKSPSQSPSISKSISPSVSPSISPSVSPSASRSPSVSPSQSPSSSVSPSSSLSASISPSVSPSVSPSDAQHWTKQETHTVTWTQQSENTTSWNNQTRSTDE